ncbi:hypothetical protein ABZW32_24450 [Streptomyces sp. NPDC004667]|uniref:hypothetical protein n=1 Tax=Streptomyces sp. NPDC004667 TaxID=3154285 RepID=UPI0033AD8BF3
MEIQRFEHGSWDTEYFLADVESFVGPRELGEAILQDWVAQAGTHDHHSFRALVRPGNPVAETTAVATGDGDGRAAPG